jgi:hypothetical protein
MFKRFILKLAIKEVIKKMPKYKLQAKDIIDKNADNILDKVEQYIETLLLNIIAKKENK